jgi:hypothetical protein
MEQRVKVTIIGKAPLLTHNPAKMGERKSGAKGATYIPSPKEEAENGLYVQDGKFGFPGIGIRNAYVQAAGQWKVKLPGSSKKMSARSIFATTQVSPEMCVLLDPKTGKPLKDYEIDTRRAVVQRNGILRSRPRFPVWRIDFEIVFDDAGLTPEAVEQLIPVLEDAGRRIGIGDYRPARTGWFGTFEVKS